MESTKLFWSQRAPPKKPRGTGSRGRGLPGEVKTGPRTQVVDLRHLWLSQGWRHVWRMGRRKSGAQSCSREGLCLQPPQGRDGRELVGPHGRPPDKIQHPPRSAHGCLDRKYGLCRCHSWKIPKVGASQFPWRPQKGTKPKIRSFPRGEISRLVSFLYFAAEAAVGAGSWTPRVHILRMSPQPLPCCPRPRPVPTLPFMPLPPHPFPCLGPSPSPRPLPSLGPSPPTLPSPPSPP